MKRAPPAPQSVDAAKQRYPAVARNINNAESGSWGRRAGSLGEESLSVTRGGDAAGRAAHRGTRHSRSLRGREDAPSRSESAAALVDGGRERGLTEMDAETSEATGTDGAVGDGDDIRGGQDEMGGSDFVASTEGAGGGDDSDKGESYGSGGDEGGTIKGGEESGEGAASSKGTGVLFSDKGTEEIEGNYTALVQDNTTEALQGNNTELVQGNSTELVEGNDTALVQGNGTAVEGYSTEALQAYDTAIAQGNSTEAFDGNSTMLVQQNSSVLVPGNDTVLDQANATANIEVFQEEGGVVETQQGESTGGNEGWGWDVASAQKISEGVGEPIEAMSTSAVGAVKGVKGGNADEAGEGVGGEQGWENEAGGEDGTAEAGGEIGEVAATSEGSDAPFSINGTEAMQGNSTALGQGNSTSLDQGNSKVLDQGYSTVLAGGNDTLLDEGYSTALDLGNATTLVQGNGTALVQGNSTALGQGNSTDLVQGTSTAVDQGYSTEAFEGNHTVLQQGSNTTTVQGTDTALVQGNSTAIVQGNSSAGVDVLKEEDGVAEVQLGEQADVDKGWAWGDEAESAQLGSVGSDQPAGEQSQADHGESQGGGDMGWDWEGQEGTGGDGTDGGEKLTAVPAGSSGEAPPESGVLPTVGNSTVVDVTSPGSQGVLGAGQGEGVGGGGEGSGEGIGGMDEQGAGAGWGWPKEEQEEGVATGGGDEVGSPSTISSLGEGTGIMLAAGPPIEGNSTASLTTLQEGDGDEARQGGGQGSGGGGWGGSNESRDGVGGGNGEREGSDHSPPAFQTETATPAQGSGSADPDPPVEEFREEGEQVKPASGAWESSTEWQHGAEGHNEVYEVQSGAGSVEGRQSAGTQHFDPPGSEQEPQAAASSAEGSVAEKEKSKGAGNDDETPKEDSLAPNDLPNESPAGEKSGIGNASSESQLGNNCTSDEECGGGQMHCSSSACACLLPWEGVHCKENPCLNLTCENCRDKQAADGGSVGATWGCTWDAGVCISSALPLAPDAFAACPEAAVVPAAEGSPPELWRAAALPVLVVFFCGGLLIGVARCIRKWTGGGSSGPEYTPVDTAQGVDSAGGDNWGWEGDGDDIEMPMVPKTLAPSGSASPPVSGSGSTAAVAVAPAAMQGLSLGGSGEARSKAEAKRGRGASGGRRGRGGAGGRGKAADRAILADDDLFAELGIEAKPTFRGTTPARRPSNRGLALQASDAMGGNASWVDDDLDDLLK